MLAVILTVIAAVSVGAGMERRANAVAHAIRTWALRAMLWVLVPFVAYVNVARAHLSVDAGVALGVAVVAVVAAGTVTWRLSRGPLRLARPATGAAIICTIQANTAYLGLPLCSVLFTHAQFTQAVAYDALVTLPMLVLGSYSVGAIFGTRGEAGGLARLRAGVLRNPVLAAAAAGLLVPNAWAPHVLVEPSRIAVWALLPLGFYIVGVTLADEAKDGALRFPPQLTPPVAVVGAVRLLFVPAALLLANALFVSVPAPFFLLAAMPVGINTVVVAHATGLDLRLPAAAIAWTTTVALVVVAALDVAGVIG